MPKTQMTNQEFADAIGCHHSMASRLRSGSRLPSIDLMERISQEFQIPITELLSARREGAEEFGRVLRDRVFGHDS